MIDMTKMCDALSKQIAAAGHWHYVEDGVVYTSNDAAVQAIIDAYTLDDAKADKCAEVLAYAKSLRDKVIASISAGEMASWPIKLSEAAKYLQTGDESTAPMLSTEALARGITLAQLVAKVDNNAQQFSMLESLIAGTDGKHRDAIKELARFDDVIHYDYSAGWPGV